MRIWLALFAALAMWSPALAFDDPKALADAIYAPYVRLGASADEDPAQYYSERLRGLVSANALGQSEGKAEPIEFNPLIGAQSSLLRDLAISAPVVNRDRALVTVSFTNFDHAALMSLSLVKEADGWKVDDIASFGDGENWLLSWLLQYDPFAIR